MVNKILPTNMVEFHHIGVFKNIWDNKCKEIHKPVLLCYVETWEGVIPIYLGRPNKNWYRFSTSPPIFFPSDSNFPRKCRDKIMDIYNKSEWVNTLFIRDKSIYVARRDGVEIYREETEYYPEEMDVKTRK